MTSEARTVPTRKMDPWPKRKGDQGERGGVQQGQVVGYQDHAAEPICRSVSASLTGFEQAYRVESRVQSDPALSCR